MGPTIMKLLDEDEDESMHSGADVEALLAALNCDIGDDPAVVAPPLDPDATVSSSGVLMQSSSSESEQVIRQWKTPSEVGDDQIGQNEQNQPLQSSEQHSSGGELVQRSSIQPRVEQLNHLSKQDQMTFQQEITHSNNCQQQSEANSVKPVDKGPEQSNIPVLDTIADTMLDVAHLSEKQQQQHIVQQSNSQQTPNIANAAAQPSERQQHIMQQSNSRQTLTSSQSNMALRTTKTASSIPFHMLIQILEPHLDNDRSMQLHSIFNKLRNNEVSKEDFLRVIRNIVSDQTLRQAAQKAQMQQLQAQASQNTPSNTNLFSLPAQASSQQVSRGGTQQIYGAQSFPALHSLPSQNVIVPASSPGQPHVPALHPSTGPREVGIGSNGKGPHLVQNYSNSMNMSSSERDGLMGSTQSINWQQKLQSSISVSGSTDSYNTHAYPRPSMNSSTSFRANLESHPRPVSHTQGLVSTLIRPTQPMNTMRMSAYQQSSNSEAKRPQTDSLANHSTSLPNQIAWQMSAKSSGLQSTSYVNHEVVDQSSEPSKVQFSSSETTSFGTSHFNQGNSAFGSSMVRTNQVSGSVPSQADQNTQQVTSASVPPTGSTTKSPLKKPSAGQKKPLDALGSSPPMSSKKQKTAGTSLDQSIEQLNDVTVVSGVNLREEEEQLLSGPKEDSRASEATRRVVQEEEDRLILQKAPLQKKISDIMLKCGLKIIGGDVERCLSMCVEEHLKGLISYLIRLSKQRVDIEKSRHRFVITSDVRGQIFSMNQKAKEEYETKQVEGTEKHRKVTDLDGNTEVDAEKDKEDGRSEAVKANKEEDDKLRTTAANVAARAAVGGDDMLSKWQLMAERARQKREGFDGAPASQLGKSSSSKSSLNLGIGSREIHESEKKDSSMPTSGGVRRLGRNGALAHPKIARKISVKDVIAALEKEPQMSKSSLIYRLYEKSSGDSPAA
ncbi:transcription initiation factor TFIID subunit 4b-like isoform X1 [Zingiber officinale]|uniref:transcription initiation factor TFIID subunit 4b-like isoform X1 n=2 Tax=Zingiber officinale TaxID=94328 RepID=UPI001C4DA09D|nr:transcription initiation factor TFIID subunit 4b-like isoform X1 [Zingiber officinale]XP_042381645.1 transcription initiation factor TFIID subunit 4b-like isoform X1 [Zingiber officinale]XP_042381646.1 transcription initiation factor TFIID subunit 4b-like isoform X1 [Zingiber officinale]XP_042381648.1 transcription initiation factor TFIID subunit 4b-like isoform X1 [Zingiber officinale]XP_042381649.1 transcription initiation factor TFIID subunit 4b-like isoform X1 [Zingiber officinale]XP_04